MNCANLNTTLLCAILGIAVIGFIVFAIVLVIGITREKR